MATHGLCVPFGLAVILTRQRSFGHQRPQPGVVRGISEVRQLFIADT